MPEEASRIKWWKVVLVLASLVLMLAFLSVILRFVLSVLAVLSEPPSERFVDPEGLRLLVWAAVAGLCIGAAVRLVRKI